jgi:hypothetical protein
MVYDQAHDRSANGYSWRSHRTQAQPGGGALGAAPMWQDNAGPTVTVELTDPKEDTAKLFKRRRR